MKWRFIDLDLVDPHTGPAVFEAIMAARQKNLAADTILFWRPKTPAVYIGYHQFAHEDINVEACKKAKIPIIRRTLGGGTGYCDENQIIYNIIFSTETQEIPAGAKGVYQHVLQGLINALNLFGITDAEIEETRYSVIANGKKISGSGQLSSQSVVDSSGSFLIDFDYKEMSKFLLNPVKNLKKGITKPEDGLTTLRRELKKEISIGDTKLALRKGFEQALGKSNDGFLTEYELSLAETLRPKYLTGEWTFRADLRKELRLKK